MHDEKEPSHEGRPDPLPDALRNWQVMEVDSQATPVPDPVALPVAESVPQSTTERAAQRTAAGPADRGEDLSGLQIGDRTDEVIVATLDNRRRQVECGATAEYAISVLNNGAQTAVFQVQIEGWIDPQWVVDALPLVTIEPGRRAVLRLPLGPPRHAGSEAGDYHFAVTVRSAHYPDHTARLGALLTVLPFDALDLRFLDPPDAAVSWLQRTARLPLSLTNRGNGVAQITLHATDGGRGCRFFFAAPNGAGGAALTLQPNQSITFPLHVEVQRPPLLGLHLREVDVQVEARVSGQAAAFARTELAARPLFGPWQMAAALGAAAAGAAALLLVMALVYLLAQRSAPQQATAAVPAAVPVPPIIIVTLNQPAADPATNPAAAPAPAPATGSTFAAGAAPDPGLPLVLPDQVSAPDGPIRAPAAAPFAAPAAALPVGSGAAPEQSANLTYSEMFRTVGGQFDLDWRMLAAQAYVESGFDSLALSDAGAMGLMQVLPDTWREWAPAVEVSDPFDAYSSVLVAAAYLDYLRQQLAAQGYPDSRWMLVAYNWGPDRLNSFLTGGGDWETLPDVRRQYASEILRIAQSIP